MATKIFKKKSNIKVNSFIGFIEEESNNLQWIFTPVKVYAEVVKTLEIEVTPHDLVNIDINHKKRASWIVEYSKKKKYEE